MTPSHLLARIAGADRAGFTNYAAALRDIYRAEHGVPAPGPELLAVRAYLHSASPFASETPYAPTVEQPPIPNLPAFG